MSEATPVFPFIVGCGRSGTTLVRSMLAAGPDLAIPPESGFIVPLHRYARRRYGASGGFDTEKFVSDVLAHPRVRNWGLRAGQLAQAFAASPVSGFAEAVRRVYETYASQLGKPRYGEKTPDYIRDIPTLALLFPEARFLHLVRDGRDVALSLVETGIEPGPVGDAALYWKREVEAGRRDGRALGNGRYQEIRYEDLIDDPHQVLRAVCEFFQVAFDGAMLRYFERPLTSLALTAKEQRIHRNLTLAPTKGLRDWRHQLSVEQSDLVEGLIGGTLASFGYGLLVRQRTVRSGIRAFAHRLGAAARLTIRRERNMYIKVRNWATGRQLPQVRVPSGGLRRHK